jgi:hypothetical protein
VSRDTSARFLSSFSAESLDVSLGLASKVKQALLEQGFAVERDRLLYVRNPDDLLRAWVENYRPKIEQHPVYFMGDPAQAEAAIAEWCLSNNIRYGLTQFSGAWRAAPAVRYQRSTIYVAGLDDEAWAIRRSRPFRPYNSTSTSNNFMGEARKLPRQYMSQRLHRSSRK